MAAKKRRRNPAEQLMLGGQLFDPHGRGGPWAGRSGPQRAPIWTPKYIKPEPEPEMYSHPQESAYRQKKRWKREREEYAPKESPARKRARAARAATAKRKKAAKRRPPRKAPRRPSFGNEAQLRAWLRKFKAQAQPRRKPRHGKLTGKAKAAFLRRMAAGRRKAAPPRKAKRKKLTGAAKAAFLRRMAAGRGKWRPHSKAYVYRAQHRKGVKKHLHALRGISPRSKVAGLVRINPRTGALTMTRVANPSKKHRRRARNPSFSGAKASIKASAMPMALGGLAGLGAGYMDAKLLGTRPTIAILAKLAAAIVGAAVIGKRHPMAAAGWAGGMVGSTGYHGGVILGGGMVGLSPSGTLKGVANMAAKDPELASMIAGLGDVVDTGLGDASDEYNAALADADDEMADVVEDEG